MAQNVFLNLTVDASASSRTNIADHQHTVSGGTSASGDLTLSYDSAKITSLALLEGAILALRRRALAAGLK